MNHRVVWFKEYASLWLERVGIKEGYVILDFGSGEGNYAIPAAQAVGPKGRVYAYERDSYIIKKLYEEKRYFELSSMEVVRAYKDDVIPFDDKMFDMVLFYDVLHSYYFTHVQRRKLLSEAYRVLKDDGVLSVFPKHMIEDEFVEEAEDVGFLLLEKIPLRLLHYGFLEEGIILNFKKNLK